MPLLVGRGEGAAIVVEGQHGRVRAAEEAGRRALEERRPTESSSRCGATDLQMAVNTSVEIFLPWMRRTRRPEMSSLENTCLKLSAAYHVRRRRAAAPRAAAGAGAGLLSRRRRRW